MWFQSNGKNLTREKERQRERERERERGRKRERDREKEREKESKRGIQKELEIIGRYMDRKREKKDI